MGVSQNSAHHKRPERYRPPPSILVVFHAFLSVTPMAHTFWEWHTCFYWFSFIKRPRLSSSYWGSDQNGMMFERLLQRFLLDLWVREVKSSKNVWVSLKMGVSKKSVAGTWRHFDVDVLVTPSLQTSKSRTLTFLTHPHVFTGFLS